MSYNVALNKAASASGYVAPFAPRRAVDGVMAPVRRWVCAAMPCWFGVDLGNAYWINRWVVKHMGAAGWQGPGYNMNSYTLRGSLDNANWFEIDTVPNNTAGITDRNIQLTQVRYIRVFVSRGLAVNPGVASIAELEVYGTQSLLSNLVVKSGKPTVPINPIFNPVIFAYSASVANSVSSVSVTPTAPNSSAVITVNGNTVISGQPSPQINLIPGENNIIVEVAAPGDDKYSYKIVVTRLDS